MSEILNKLLLIAFSCIIFLIFLPILLPLVEFLTGSDNYDLNNDAASELNQNIETFKFNIENYINSSNIQENNYTFNLNYNNSVIWLEKSSNLYEFTFILYYQPNKFPIFRNLNVGANLDIIILSTFFNYYSIQAQNSTILITFL